MNEDTRTLHAFLAAIAHLQEPLPDNMLRQLHEIEQDLPESIYRLYELAEQFDPLHHAYILALQSQPKEGERLKFATTLAPTAISSEQDELLFQLRYQIALLQDSFHESVEMSEQELAYWQNSAEAEQMERQWTETFASSQDVLASLADEALEEFRQGQTQPLGF